MPKQLGDIIRNFQIGSKTRRIYSFLRRHAQVKASAWSVYLEEESLDVYPANEGISPAVLGEGGTKPSSH